MSAGRGKWAVIEGTTVVQVQQHIRPGSDGGAGRFGFGDAMDFIPHFSHVDVYYCPGKTLASCVP